MPLTIWNCDLSYQEKNISVKMGMLFQEITSITEFPGSNFLLPTIYTGSNWDFQVGICYLLLLISNPVSSIEISMTGSTW